VIFLKSRRGVNFAETSLDRYKAHIANVAVVIPPGTAGEKAGEQLIADRACTACHKLGDKDGGIAPDLSYEGLIRDNAWLMDHFKNPRSRVPDSIMPTFRFPDEDFEHITAYLGSLKTPPPAMPPAETYKALCERCHGEKGDGKAKWPGTWTPRRAI
jgi:cytochrome c2